MPARRSLTADVYEPLDSVLGCIHMPHSPFALTQNQGAAAPGSNGGPVANFLGGMTPLLLLYEKKALKLM